LLLVLRNAARGSYGLVKHQSFVAGGACVCLRFHARSRVRLRAAAVIDDSAILKIFATLMGCWALGYGIGVAVAFVYRIRDVA
jgi:hypothetical protein